MTSVVISQPQYFAWPGFLDLVAKADVYIHLDDAQFSKGSFTNRVQIKHSKGTKWLTIPLAGKGTFQVIADLHSDGTDWKERHRRLLQECLDGAPHLAQALLLFDEVTAQDRLIDVLTRSVERSAQALNLNPSIVFETASKLNVPGRSWRRVLDLVHAVGGTRYVTAHGAAHYLDHKAFEKEGVSVEYMRYEIEAWPQFHGPFTPFVTLLDLLAHRGDQAPSHLKSGTVAWREYLQERDDR